jgi:TonB family protein
MNYTKRGLIGTVVFHIVLLAIILIAGFSTPLPLPAEEGILINFGTDQTGAGALEPSISEEPAQQPSPPESAESAEGEEEIMTQDFEDAPVMVEKDEAKEEKKEQTTESTPEESTRKETKPEKPERQVDRRALFPGRNQETNNNTAEGTTSGQGKQGSESGSVDAEDYSQGLSSGGGGVSFSLSGRNPQSLPKPAFDYQEEGKVVVEITVDREGNVTDAVPGVKGSTTLNSYLLNEAKKAALRSKFDRKPDAPAYQKGTVTYHFKLR